MNESVLRQYVRRELLKEEYGSYMSAQDLYDIFDSIKDVWEVTKVAIKDVLSAAVYVYDVAVAANGEEIAKAQKRFYDDKQKIAGEYSAALSKVQERMGKDFKMVAFLANPGAYLLVKAYDSGPQAAKDVIQFLAEAGMDFEMPARDAKGEPDDTEIAIRQNQLDSALGKTTSYTQANFVTLQKDLISRLDAALGMRGTTTEGVSYVRNLLLEEKSVSKFDNAVKGFQKDMRKELQEKLKDFDMSKIVDPADQKKLLETKKEEAKSYVSILNAPTKFVVSIGKAKTMADVRKATEFLKGTPYRLDGIGPEEEKKIAEQAKQLAKDSREKKKVKQILDAAESKVSPEKVTDEELYDACVVVLTKNAIDSIAKMFEDPDKAGDKAKKLVADIEKYKGELLETFMDGLTDDDLTFMEKSKSGREFAEVIRGGRNAIKASGLRSSKGGG
jgi:nucleotide-binding universal stress UspA family protein